MDSKPATPLSEQSDKTKKYDRQLRLWGDHGQAALESAHVCLCGSSAASTPEGLGSSGVLGAEVLRSLVLPGIGKITVLDDALVTQSDLGNNLFVTKESIGTPRGEQLLQCLLEMNPDVRGSFVDQSVEGVLLTQPHFFDGFSVVVAVNMQEKPLMELSECLWRANVPLVVVRSYGFIGYIRIQIEELTIVESHPENEFPDLRLLNPFPALKKYFDSIDLDALSDKEHSHTPYVVIIYKFLNKWIAEHGKPPQNYKEKKLFGQMIRGGMRQKSSAEPEENFEEAVKAVNTCLGGPAIPPSLEELFSLLPSPITPSTPPFWLVVAGLKTFVDEHKQLPVTGVVPDMTADSVSYIELQNIYRERAAAESEAVLRHTQDRCQQFSCMTAALNEGRSAGPEAGVEHKNGGGAEDPVSESLVRSMCRHAAHLKVVRGTSVASEYSNKVHLGGGEVEVCDSDLVWYVLLRAVDAFHSEFRCYPGFYDHQVEADIVRLKGCVNRLLSDWGGGGGALLTVKDDHVHEMCRYGAAQNWSLKIFQLLKYALMSSSAEYCMEEDFVRHYYKYCERILVYWALMPHTAAGRSCLIQLLGTHASHSCWELMPHTAAVSSCLTQLLGAHASHSCSVLMPHTAVCPTPRRTTAPLLPTVPPPSVTAAKTTTAATTSNNSATTTSNNSTTTTTSNNSTTTTSNNSTTTSNNSTTTSSSNSTTITTSNNSTTTTSSNSTTTSNNSTITTSKVHSHTMLHAVEITHCCSDCAGQCSVLQCSEPGAPHTLLVQVFLCG
ncbi:THIF-type NAD/FAD binding fold [Trinorchestia longiramus]|nr:THIF-type NAD/FAD binding fold [Trinorchestia longiramus]